MEFSLKGRTYVSTEYVVGTWLLSEWQMYRGKKVPHSDLWGGPRSQKRAPLELSVSLGYLCRRYESDLYERDLIEWIKTDTAYSKLVNKQPEAGRVIHGSRPVNPHGFELFLEYSISSLSEFHGFKIYAILCIFSVLLMHKIFS